MENIPKSLVKIEKGKNSFFLPGMNINSKMARRSIRRSVSECIVSKHPGWNCAVFLVMLTIPTIVS